MSNISSLYNAVDEIREMLFGVRQTEQTSEAILKALKESYKSGSITIPPKYLMMKVTNRCNSNCIYCDHAANHSSHEIKSEISFHVLRKIIQQAVALGVSAVSLSGGEPLLRDDIPLLIEEILIGGIVPVLLTNGLLLPKKWKDLGSAGLRYLIISIDSMDSGIYQLQRGASLSQAMNGLRAALAMRERYGNVKIHVTVVVTKHNIVELPNFIRTMNREEIAVQLSPYHHFNNRTKDLLSPKNKSIVRGTVEELLQIKEEGLRLAGTVEFISHISDFFLNHQRIPQGYHCLAGSLAMFVDAHCNVLPCWSESFKSLGNLEQQSLNDIWYSEPYAHCRRQMVRCACEGCWYLCTAELTTLCNEGGCVYG